MSSTTLFQQTPTCYRLSFAKLLSIPYVASLGKVNINNNQLRFYHNNPRAAYVHLPFCKRKCFYCDFPIVALGRIGEQSPLIPTYINHLQQEIKASLPAGSLALETIYFGGGTPSLVQPSVLREVIDSLRNKFGLEESAEVSMEADPGTFDLQKLLEYKSAGVTRLSLGIQIFDDALLSDCGRSHNLAQALQAIEDVKRAGFSSWSLDLISGLPKLTHAIWRRSLKKAIDAAPNHISVYDLQVEPGTPFSRWRDEGRLVVHGEEEATEMYGAARDMLTAAGFEHYELSNYAQPGHQCRHNNTYWLGKPYYAYGMGAASYVQGRRFTRPPKFRRYIDWVERSVAAAEKVKNNGGGDGGGGMVTSSGDEQLFDQAADVETREELVYDTIMLRLRTSAGLPLSHLAVLGGDTLVRQVLRAVAPHVRSGSVVVDRNRKRRGGDGKSLRPGEGNSDPRPGEGEGEGNFVLDLTGGTSGGMSGGSSKRREVKSATNSHGSDEISSLPYGNEEAVIRLVDPAGFLLSNTIISDIFAAVTVTD